MVLGFLKRHGIEARKVASTHGGEYASPCPRCGGDDRFRVWPEQGDHGTWYCRACDKGGDAIEFLREFDGMTFGEACKELGVARDYVQRPLALPGRMERKAYTPKEYGLPSELWMGKATALASYAHEQLVTNTANRKHLEWLAVRGLSLDAVCRFRLGWLPGEVTKNGAAKDCYHRSRKGWGLSTEKDEKTGKEKRLWIPRGLVIPAFDGSGNAIRLRIRRMESDRARFLPDLPYYALPGSWMGALLIDPMFPAPLGEAFVVVESELDGMAVAHATAEAKMPVAVLSIGNTTVKPDAATLPRLEKALAILSAFDFDKPDKDGSRPGAKAAAWWAATFPRNVRHPVPVGKDPGEAAKAGISLALWVRTGLPPVLRVTGQATRKEPVSNTLPNAMTGGLTPMEGQVGQGGEEKIAPPAIKQTPAPRPYSKPRTPPPPWVRAPIAGELLDATKERACASTRCVAVIMRKPELNDAQWQTLRYCCGPCYSGEPSIPLLKQEPGESA